MSKSATRNSGADVLLFFLDAAVVLGDVVLGDLRFVEVLDVALAMMNK